MKIDKMSNMKGGWFIGDFTPSTYQTSNFEVCHKIHKQGEKWDVHYHAKAIEINYLIRGKMTIQDTLLETGDIFTLDQFEIADPEFLEDCELIIVKVPSVAGDKIVCQKNNEPPYCSRDCPEK